MLFEKKNFRLKPPHAVKPSILSVRLEQCPLQLNNPFNEYSKFDGKVSKIGTVPLKDKEREMLVISLCFQTQMCAAFGFLYPLAMW